MRRGDLAAHEAFGAAVPLFEPARHLVEHVDDDVAACRRVARQRACRGGLEQHREMTFAAQVSRRVGGEQRAAAVHTLGHVQVAAQFEQQRVARSTGAVHERQRGIARHVDAQQLPAFEQQVFEVEEVQRSHEQRALETRRAIDRDRHRHVLRLALEHRHRGRQRRAALPALNDARVARIGHRPGADVGADVDGVRIDPFDVGLGLGQRETAFDEAEGVRVELAHDVGVGAAARQRDQAAPVLGAQRLRAAPDPVLVLGGGECIEIEQGLPARLRFAVLGQRRAPPQAARLGLVLPEVVEPVAAPRAVGDALVRVQDRQQTLARRREIGPRFEQRLRLGVALTHPGQRALAVDVFEPQERVFGIGAHIAVHGSTTRLWVSGWRWM